MCLTDYQQPQVAAVIIICFCGLVRMSAALKLLNKDVLDCGHALVLVIGAARGGMEQKALLTHPDILHFAREYKTSEAIDNPEAKFLPVSYNKVQTWLQRALEEPGFPGGWTTHRLRRGGAAELLRRQVPLLMGWWQLEKSLSEYLRRRRSQC